MRSLLFFLSSILSNWLYGQCVNKPVDNMTCYFRYDDDGAASSGSLTFNDIWGYVDPQGNEYAILGGFDSIYIFDVTDPINTIKVAVDDPPGTSVWRDFKVYGHYMYAVADQGTTGLRVYDLDSIPVGKLHLVAAYTNDFVRTHNIFVDEERAKLYVAGSDLDAVREGLLIYDLQGDAKSRNPMLLNAFRFDTLVSSPGSNFYVHDIFVRQDTAFCSHGNKGYYIWDLSVPTTPKLVGFIDQFGNENDTYYVHSSWNTEDNQFAYVATELSSVADGRKIFIIDQSDMSNPSIVSTWIEPLLSSECGQVNNVPHNPFVKDDQLIISYYQDGVQILDIATHPTEPERIGYYDTEPENTTYGGTTANWGVFPFFPSGTIVASDTRNGLFVLRVGCEDQMSIADEIIAQDRILTASNEIELNNISIANDAHLTLIAPVVSLKQLTGVMEEGELTIVNENVCN